MEKHGEMRFRGGDVHGNTVWAGCESRDQGAVRAWDIHVETRAVDRLQALLRQRVPLRLDDDVVVRLTSEPPGIDDQP